MSYEITVTEYREVKKLSGGVWTVIGTKEEFRDKTVVTRDDEPRTRIVDVYGYTPQFEKIEQENVAVFNQRVDALDLAAVIKAINKL